MPKMVFTEASVARLKAAPAQVDWFENLFKGRTLICTVNTSGLKSWSVGYYVELKPRRAKMGTWPAMPVRDAKKAGREFDADRAAQVIQSGSFRDIAERYFRQDVEAKGLRSASEIRRMLQKYIYPAWAEKPFVEIRRGEVNALLDGIEAKGQADAVLALIRQITNWYAARHDDYASPIVRGMRRHKTNGNGKRWLQDDEIKALWSACDQVSPLYGAFIKLALLTGQRREKIATMRWTDLQNNHWVVERADREKGCPARVKFTKSALDALATLPRIVGCDWVFPAISGKTYVNPDYLKTRIDKVLPNLPHWSLHDLRRTCRKLLTRAGVSVDVAEMCLGHSLKGVRSVYDDPREYDPHLDDAFAKVEAEVLKILSGQNLAKPVSTIK